MPQARTSRGLVIPPESWEKRLLPAVSGGIVRRSYRLCYAAEVVPSAKRAIVNENGPALSCWFPHPKKSARWTSEAAAYQVGICNSVFQEHFIPPRHATARCI